MSFKNVSKPALMAILNCTPDSFFEESRFADTASAIEKGLQFIQDGADLIDIGAESSRPGAAPVSEEEELRRALPVIQALAGKIPLSIDTTKPSVAKAALQEGACFLNDITGFSKKAMRELAAASGCKICVMHMQGEPRTMQVAPHYEKGVVFEIQEWFKKRVDLLLKEGVKPQNIYLDPGIGFGKKVEDNLEILKNLSEFQKLGLPILLGISRKSFMQKILKKTARDVLSTTLSLNTMALLQGIAMLRVHDVPEHRAVIDMLQCFK